MEYGALYSSDPELGPEMSKILCLCGDSLGDHVFTRDFSDWCSVCLCEGFRKATDYHPYRRLLAPKAA